jgi:hypothetical protein
MSLPSEKSNAKKYFDHFCERESVYKVERELAFKALHCLERWPEFLPHVDKIDVLYDDSRYQEFLMEVQSSTGSLIKVRSVRKCIEPSEITFFQPKPPIFLKHHCGGWEFIEVGEKLTKVKAWHAWNLLPEGAAKVFPSTDALNTEKQVLNSLMEHAEFALLNWKNVLEQGKYTSYASR